MYANLKQGVRCIVGITPAARGHICKVCIGKATPLQAWTGPEGSSRFRPPNFKTIAHESGKVVSRTHRPPLPPGNIPGIHFC